MERITYRINLDAHRTGIQRTLQGFETADIMSRRIAINLVASGDAVEIPTSHVVATMYVTMPSDTSPRIHDCVIEGNTIIYDVEPITEEGITEMQLKVIETSVEGAKSVLLAPRFAVEVTKSNANDNTAVQSDKFTALDNALAKAQSVYESRLLRVVIEEDCVFKAYYADGTVYENDYFRDAIYNGNVLLSQSYAVGGSGIRAGEDTDNSKYYSNVSKSASEDANLMYNESHELLNEAKLYTNYTYFSMNFETGELGYVSPSTNFSINKKTGNLETNRDTTYTPEDIIKENVESYINDKSVELDDRINYNKNTAERAESLAERYNNDANIRMDSLNLNIKQTNYNLAQTNLKIDAVEALAKGRSTALSFDRYLEMTDALQMMTEELPVGQSIYIKNAGVPDVWVSGISETPHEYIYTSEDDFANDLKADGTVQVGKYILYALETDKVDLAGYAKHEDVDEKIRELRGGDGTLTIADAFSFAREKFTKANILILEGSEDIPITDNTNVLFVPFPEGFNIENCCVIGSMVKLEGDSGWTTCVPRLTANMDGIDVHGMHGSVYMHEMGFGIQFGGFGAVDGMSWATVWYKLVIIKNSPEE